MTETGDYYLQALSRPRFDWRQAALATLGRASCSRCALNACQAAWRAGLVQKEIFTRRQSFPARHSRAAFQRRSLRQRRADGKPPAPCRHCYKLFEAGSQAGERS